MDAPADPACSEVPKWKSASGYVRPGASQGETRSHGFFFKPDTAGGGVLELPVLLRGGAWSQYRYGSAEVAFLGTPFKV